MEALLGKAEERKSGKSSASRPKGYWAAFGACVLLVSSAQLLHESASWSLDYGTVLGTFINLRAQSCNAHAAGLILGYALAQMRPDRLRAIALNDRFWVFFFALQTANVMAFYWSVGTSNVMTMIIVQVAGAASGASFLAMSFQSLSGVGARVFLATVVALVALTTLTVQGLFSILEAGAPALVSEILHMALVAGSAACFVRAMGAGACLRVQFEREPYAPMGAPRRRGESQGRHRGAPSFALFLIIGAYGAVFGFLHVVPLALSLDVSSRVTAFLFGAVAALGLFSATLRQSDGTDVVRLWNRFYQYVFPIVTVAALLGPLTMDTEFLPLLILQACALYYFDVLLAVASYTIARVIKASPTQVFARAFLVKSAGFFLGCLVGFGVHESVVLDETAFSVIGAAIFVILSLVTFHTNSEKFAKTVWGLLPHEDAHGKLASRRAECCRRLARSSGLTDREAEILEYLVAGKRPKEISEMLVVSITTVRSHVRAIYAKTGVHSHGELMHLLDEK